MLLVCIRLRFLLEQCKDAADAKAPAKAAVCPITARARYKLVFENSGGVREIEVEDMPPGFDFQTNAQRVIEPEVFLLLVIFFRVRLPKG